MKYILKLIFILFAVGQPIACHKLTPRGKKKGPPRKDSIVDLKRGGYFDRTDKSTTGMLTFFTTIDAQCEVHYWPIKANSDSHDDATIVPCPGESVKSEYSLPVGPLVADGLYQFDIYAWPAKTGSKEEYEPYTIEELQGGHTFFGQEDLTSAAKIGEMLIAKIDLPLGTAFLYRHEFTQKKKREDLSKLLERRTGCYDTRDPHEQFEAMAKMVRVSGVSTRGFATGNATEPPKFDDRVLLEFQKGLQNADRWDWNFRYLNASHTLSMTPSSTLSTLTVESKDLVILDRRNFDDGLKELPLDVATPLKLSWKSLNATDNSYLTVQLGHSSLKSATYCTFAAKLESATIEEKYLQSLPEGSHYLLVALEDEQIQLGKDNSQPSWIFASHDWRAIKITK